MSSTRPRHPNGVIFDLDGTLADTVQDITESIRYAAQPLGTRDIDVAEVRPHVALGARRMLQTVTGCDEPATLDLLLQRFRAHYTDHSLGHTSLFPGWAAVLDELTRRGAPLAVLSNKPDAATQKICAALLAAWPFAAFVGLKEGIPGKPNPASALGLCKLLNRLPEEMLFVGDSPVDVETALRGGFLPVGVNWGYQTASEISTAGARHLLKQPADLLPLL